MCLKTAKHARSPSDTVRQAKMVVWVVSAVKPIICRRLLSIDIRSDSLGVTETFATEQKVVEARYDILQPFFYMFPKNGQFEQYSATFWTMCIWT